MPKKHRTVVFISNMAGPKGSKYYNVFLDYGIWLTHRESNGRLDDGIIRLLEAVQKTGTLREAAINLGVSYRKAWGDLRDAAAFVGFPLIETERGGRDGGVTRLTPDGADLVAAFSQLHDEIQESIHRTTKRFFHDLNKIQ